MKVRFEKNISSGRQLKLPFTRKAGFIRTSQKLYEALLKKVKRELEKIHEKNFLQTLAAMEGVVILDYIPLAFVSLADVVDDELIVCVTFSILGKPIEQNRFIFMLLNNSKIKNPHVEDGKWFMRIKLSGDYPVEFRFPDTKLNINGNAQRSFALHSELVSLGLL